MRDLPTLHRTLSRRTAGFTLIELMISIAMVVLLVAGINAVFQAATKTTSMGLATEEMTRSMRVTEQQLSRDFSHAVSISEMPCLTIYSMQQFAFRNRADMNNDPDGRPQTIDINGDGKEVVTAPGEVINPFIYNDRNHRVDRIGFFARNAVTPYQAQTGALVSNGSNPWPLVTPDKSTEAWIWYGHLRVPTMPARPSNVQQMRGGVYYDPGEGNPQDNARNFFSDDWCFGRMAILLRDIGNDGDPSYLQTPMVGTWDIPMPPLAGGSYNGAAQAGRRWTIEESRLDMANASIRWFRDEYYDILVNQLMKAFDYRFNCKPWITRTSNAEQQAAEVAMTVPFLQRGVSHFAVEFAGDFITQLPATGLVDNFATGGDGEIDYVLIPDPNDNVTGAMTPAQRARATKKIRWYGMPRNADRRNDFPDGRPSIPTNTTKALYSEDVIPLRDVVPWSKTDMQADVRAFEFLSFWDPRTRRTLDRTMGNEVPRPNDYATYINPRPGMNLVYNCTWSAAELENSPLGVPSMIRIVMTLSDGNGRLPEGQTVEYVFKLTK